jgi:uncharacterized protein
MKYEHKDLLKESLKNSKRIKYPDAEGKYRWLSTLLDTYHIIDIGSSIELKFESNRRKQTIACHRGCFHCCLKPTVPIAPPEIWGISWWANEILTKNDKDAVANQLMRTDAVCPFLLNNTCLIYPMRPIACRIFFVFGNQCTLGEDPWVTRRIDIWTHSRYIAMRAAMTILPLFGITEQDKKMESFQNGFLEKAARNMHELDWTPMHDIMQ